ncbi:hypothetical protein GCM10022198_25860 [Klugiella xanthotipulae]|uniref:Uncharacterized protein DUF3180 n=1 Tax=Klugiella xanthotipulae TaxID=244735 RepID=A0A543I5Z0_9MICO|nr:DUF3180 domain-containing protein [Klugiella xanthotipulae]TQM65880.1 uncharacterized protein DUF3180 [Klugiella xanthotipulae]
MSARRTSAGAITLCVLIGGGAAFLVEVGLSANNQPMIIPPLSLPLTLVLIAAVIVGLAIPVRRSITGASSTPVNPFAAVRLVAAAQASTLAGALFTGVGLGILGYMMTRTLAPPVESWVLVSAAALGGILLVIAGLVVEHFCTLPPPEDGSADAADQPA